jgi:hypothetical protein
MRIASSGDATERSRALATRSPGRGGAVGLAVRRVAFFNALARCVPPLRAMPFEVADEAVRDRLVDRRAAEQ